MSLDLDGDVEELTFTDDELAELAMAADPDAPLAEDAVPFASLGSSAELLPSWYMPSPSASLRGSARRRAAWVVLLIVVSLVVVNAVGLCVTSGHLEIPL